MANIFAHLYPVIIAGGSGTRLWPLSRKNRPKQFMPVGDGPSLMQATVKRIQHFCAAEQIWVVCGALHAELIEQEIPEINSQQILVEPLAKNTAPAIALAAQVILQKDPQAILLILPADHFIPESDYTKFQECVVEAMQHAAEDYLMTFGIKPWEAATGYGYIESSTFISGQTYQVSKFHEKPNVVQASEYVDAGCFYWNAGIFVWRAQTFLSELKQHKTSMWQLLQQINTAYPSAKLLIDIFDKIENISVDYAVLENCKRVRVVESNFCWNDVGALDAFANFLPKDTAHNAHAGEVLCVDANNNIVLSQDRPVVLLGVDNLAVIECKDVVLVIPKNRVQEVKKIVETLQQSDNPQWKKLL